MNQLCDYIDRKTEEGFFTPCASFFNGFVKHVGKVLVWVVYIITAFLTSTSFAIILPYEQLYKSSYLLGVLSVLGTFLVINILYHYHKARTLPPVANPGKEGDKFCKHCNYFKSDRTHHCSVCGTCVLGMDHHCIWINQCVGSHNHRHFFLFIAYLTLGMATIVVCGTNSILDHIFVEKSHRTFCTSVLQFAPLQHVICEQGKLARNSVIFCYMISALLMFLVGGLTLWNVFLISRGFTYIDYLRHQDILDDHPSFRNPLNRGFKENWRNFLGLRRNRTFVRHVLLPSSHPPILYDSYGRTEKFEIV